MSETNGQRTLTADPPDLADVEAPRRSRRPWVVLVAALAVLVAVPLTLVLGDTGGIDQRAPERGEIAPEFALPNGDRTLRLSDFAGRPLVLHFCGSWNPDCLKDAAFLAEARADPEFAGVDLAIIDVVVADDLAEARAAYREKGVDWPVVADPGATVARAYGVAGVPQAFFITGDGRVSARNFGALSPVSLEGRLRDLLAP